MCSVIIAQADADKHKSLDARFDITGFPTILFFEKGSTKPKEECVPPFQIVIPRHGFHRVFLHVCWKQVLWRKDCRGPARVRQPPRRDDC